VRRAGEAPIGISVSVVVVTEGPAPRREVFGMLLLLLVVVIGFWFLVSGFWFLRGPEWLAPTTPPLLRGRGVARSSSRCQSG